MTKGSGACCFASGLVVAGLVASASAVETAPSAGSEITSAAVAVRESLSADDLESATYDFDDEERYDLRLAPLFLEGVTLREMGEASSAKMGELVEASLGPAGRKKADDIRGLEDEVVRMEEEEVWHLALFANVMGIRGDDLYYLSFYGDPALDDAWGYRFDGHHLSLNFTVVDGAVSPTPLFFGGQPREVPPDGLAPAGLRVLAKEEDTARALYLSLNAEQRQRATLPLELDRELFIGGDERVDPALPPVGIPGDALSQEQKWLLDALVEAYLENVSTQIASNERARIDVAGRDSLHFAWAGSTTPGEAIYYRLQGPTLLIEFDNTADDAKHIHVLWRDPAGDFGADLLRQHHEVAHRSQSAKE